MENAIQIEWPKEDVRNFSREMDRARKVLGMSLNASVAYAGRLVAQSCGASTKVSKKKREIVKNPLKALTRSKDKRRADYGVYKYRANGTRKFVPIYRTGEHGTYRFVGKRKRELTVHGSFYNKPEMNIYAAKSVTDHRKRIIGRSGLAKKTWSVAVRFMNRGGTIRPMGIWNEAARITVSRKQDEPKIHIHNKLRYATDALKGGENRIETALGRAYRKMHSEINRKAAKAFGWA